MLIDTQVTRKATNCIKWNVRHDLNDDELLPMWIADMDIATAPCIRLALEKALDEKVLGYFEASSAFFKAICDWEEKRHQVSLQAKQILLSPSVTTALSLAIRHLTKPMDKILVFSPFYPPYKTIIEANHRQLVDLPLVIKDGQYTIDFNQLAQFFSDSAMTAMIMCNPHNPGGRVWSADELLKVQQLAAKHHVLIFADEIHNDISYPDLPTSSMLNDQVDHVFQQQTLVFKSATKAFNLAGAKVSFIFVKNEHYREILQNAIEQEQSNEINTLGLVATRAAYEQGLPWLNAVTAYLEDNRDAALDYLGKYLPKIKPMKTESTYLLWLDFRSYHLTDEQLADGLTKKAHLFLNAGSDYGHAGEGFMRLNFAVDRKVLSDALRRLSKFDQLYR